MQSLRTDLHRPATEPDFDKLRLAVEHNVNQVIRKWEKRVVRHGRFTMPDASSLAAMRRNLMSRTMRRVKMNNRALEMSDDDAQMEDPDITQALVQHDTAPVDEETPATRRQSEERHQGQTSHDILPSSPPAPETKQSLESFESAHSPEVASSSTPTVIHSETKAERVTISEWNNAWHEFEAVCSIADLRAFDRQLGTTRIVPKWLLQEIERRVQRHKDDAEHLRQLYAQNDTSTT